MKERDKINGLLRDSVVPAAAAWGVQIERFEMKDVELPDAMQQVMAMQAEAIREKFLPLENLRNGHGPIPVLHHAVKLAGIAETGPMLPLLGDLSADKQKAIEAAAKETLAWSRES